MWNSRLLFLSISGKLPAMNILKPLKARLDRMDRMDIELLSIRSDVPAPTISKIKRGETVNPRILTVEKLMFALKLKPHKQNRTTD